MKTHLTLVRSLIVLVALALAPVGIALAHGQPVIAVQPAVVAAGGQITITGMEMEPGEVFAITLERLSTSAPLGEAVVTGEGEDANAGFTATFTIPADTTPSSYTVRAATEEGESAETDLTVTAPSAEASAGPAMAQEPTGEQHLLDRSKPIGQIAAVVVVIALSAAAGFVLIRSRG
jgi:hypothetical protein